MKAVLKRWITGVSIPQEYVCLAVDEIKDGFQLFVTSDIHKTHPVEHVFVGYLPLIIGLVYSSGDPSLESQQEVVLQLRTEAITDQGTIRLQKRTAYVCGERRIIFYEGKSGHHRLISKMHQQINSSLANRKSKTDDFIQLTGNGYEQVRIAYALPRKISLISLGDSSAMNVFPTDLHGPVGAEHYASSLRLSGRACQQVSSQRKIALSDVPVETFREVYAMGGNHQKEMRPAENFELLPARSSTFGIPLPINACSYVELEVVDTFDHGIHRIFIYRMVNRVKLKDGSLLAHIHNYALQWRMNRGLKTHFVVR
jgi:hypothetical protein